MRNWIVSAVVGLAIGTWALPEAATAADVAAPGVTRSVHVKMRVVRKYRRHRVRSHASAERALRDGRYFYCPAPQNVCQLTPRLVWTPEGYRRVFYPRLVWTNDSPFLAAP